MAGWQRALLDGRIVSAFRRRDGFTRVLSALVFLLHADGGDLTLAEDA
jgi:hypothetical protein